MRRLSRILAVVAVTLLILVITGAYGDWVSPRTVLGYVGTTGNAQDTPPHLHFGIYTATGAINPLPLLTDRTAPTVTRNKATEGKVKNRLSVL